MAGQVILLLGPTGSGKSQQAQLLSQSGWVSLSSGDLLRRAKSQDKSLEETMSRGQLVNSKSVEHIIDTAIAGIDMNKDIVLDGFPRELDEAHWLSDNLQSLKRTMRAAFEIAVSQEVSARRLSKRGRADDTTAAQLIKWDEYLSLTAPVIDYYDSLNLLHRLDGNLSIGVLGAQIADILAV